MDTGRKGEVGQGGRSMQGREGDKDGEEGGVDRKEIFETFPPSLQALQRKQEEDHSIAHL